MRMQKTSETDTVFLVAGTKITRSKLLDLHTVLTELINEHRLNVVVDLSRTRFAHPLLVELLLSKAEIAQRLGCSLSVRLGGNAWMQGFLFAQFEDRGGLEPLKVKDA